MSTWIERQARMRASVREGERIALEVSTPIRRIPWDTAAARRLLELASIEIDLRFVAEACTRALASDRNRNRRSELRDPGGAQAFWSAALVAYGRSFDASRKAALTEQDAHEAGALDHRAFVDLRNLHIAHPVDRFWERQGVNVGVSPADVSPDQRQLIVSMLIAKATFADRARIETLRRNALSLLELVNGRLEATKAAVLEEAGALSWDELYSKADTTQTPPAPSRPIGSQPRRRKRGG